MNTSQQQSPISNELLTELRQNRPNTITLSLAFYIAGVITLGVKQVITSPTIDFLSLSQLALALIVTFFCWKSAYKGKSSGKICYYIMLMITASFAFTGSSTPTITDYVYATPFVVALCYMAGIKSLAWFNQIKLAKQGHLSPDYQTKLSNAKIALNRIVNSRPKNVKIAVGCGVLAVAIKFLILLAGSDLALHNPAMIATLKQEAQVTSLPQLLLAMGLTLAAAAYISIIYLRGLFLGSGFPYLWTALCVLSLVLNIRDGFSYYDAAVLIPAFALIYFITRKDSLEWLTQCKAARITARRSIEQT